jgi:uncharacterized membrane protein
MAALLCCLAPVLLVVLFVVYTVLFNEHWNRVLDRVFPGRHRP